MHLVNLSPFSAQRMVLTGPGGEEMLLVVVKAAFNIRPGSTPHLCERQEPVCLADEHRGDPAATSLKCASEAVLTKPDTDVVLTGSAHAPGGPAPWVDVRLRVGGAIDKTVRIFGDRRWRRTLGWSTASAPEPFDAIPLIWERAFGGTDQSAAEPRNPVGVGFRAKNSERPIPDEPLPNLEDPADLMRGPKDRPAPAGFSFTSPHWEPRRLHAGTYDEAWQSSKAPLLPDDFDTRFYQCAPADQVYPGTIPAGTPLEVHNASPAGVLSCAMPPTRLSVRVKAGAQRHELPMRCDTVVVDAEAQRLTLTWRSALSVHNRIYDVEWIRVEGAPA